MGEKPIKVDEATDRIVSESASFLRTTKKSVVATAVAEYASRADAYRDRVTAAGEPVVRRAGGDSTASGARAPRAAPEPWSLRPCST